MGFDFKEREELVVSSTNCDMNQHELGSESVYRGFDSIGSSSSSSDLSTFIGSEIDSTEVESDDDEDDEFMAELTRHMADYMLQEDDDVHCKDELKATTMNCDSPDISRETYYQGQGIEGTFVNSSSVEESNNIGFQPTPAFNGDQIQPVQLYQVENQPKVRNNETRSLGRRGKTIESPRQFHYDKKQDLSQNVGRASDLANCGKAYPMAGSGMRAVFLGGLGSRNTSCGTGVFLPRAINSITPDPPRKKPGCSTVLIPTRVLQALQQHFSNFESLSPSSGSNGRPTQHGRRQSAQQKGQKQSQPEAAAMDHQEAQLPQEWTYEL